VVVAANHVAKGREPLLYSLDLDTVGNRIAKMLKFLVGGSGRDEDTLLVA
jgi:hypothetical protein